jgi:hypothetical protein
MRASIAIICRDEVLHLGWFNKIFKVNGFTDQSIVAKLKFRQYRSHS